MKHFNVEVNAGKYGLKLSRETYALINKRCSFTLLSEDVLEHMEPDGKHYTDAWCKMHRERCLENFDMNIRYFSMLSVELFEAEVDAFAMSHPEFVWADDLTKFAGVQGYYVLILDEYRQVYVGCSSDLTKRIRQHWAKNKEFDRLLFPVDPTVSSLSIDCFRALDTTRILLCPANDLPRRENEYLRCFSDEFVLNRVSGGITDGGLLGYTQAIATMKARKLDG